MISGGYRLPATVWALGLPRYTPTDAPPCWPMTSPSRAATTAKASAHVASVSVPSRRTIGRDSRSGSLSSSAKLAPFGQMKPALKTSSRSPRAPVTRSFSIVSVSPQVASQNGQIRRAVVLLACAVAAPLMSLVLLVHLRVERADVGQVAVALGPVQPIADDELVGDVEADVGDVDVVAHRVGFAHQRADPQRPRVAGREVSQQPRQRQARIDDVFDDQHVAVVDVAVEVLEDSHHARR